jgi:MscS family membrane protein
VAEVPRLYARYGYPQWVEEFRQKFPAGISFLGLELFKWAILLAVTFILWPLLWLVFYGLARIVSSPRSGLYPEIRNVLTRPLPVLIVLVVMRQMLLELGLGATAQKVFQSHTLATFMLVWLLFGVIDLIRGFRRERFLARGRDDAAVLGRPMANALKLMIALLGVLVWMSNMGVNISALLAGLGVGGIAMALAMQKPIEDLFGAITLYSQRPVVTGDVCRYGTHFGKIEEIGLRSTRIRTQGNTVVSVPNSRLAYEDIENISARKNVWYQPLIRMRIDTSPEQMQDIVARIRQMLIDDERVLNDVLRVQFRQFGEYSLDIKVHSYVDTTDFNEYLNIAEELNFRILQIIHDAGAQLALPERGMSNI